MDEFHENLESALRLHELKEPWRQGRVVAVELDSVHGSDGTGPWEDISEHRHNLSHLMS